MTGALSSGFSRSCVAAVSGRSPKERGCVLLTTTLGERDSGAGEAAGCAFMLACTSANRSVAELADKLFVMAAREVSSFAGSTGVGSAFDSSKDFFTISIS